MRPSIADAVARRPVRLTHRGWVAELLFVEVPRRRAKVRLNSGTVVWVPLDQLEVCAAAPLDADEGAANAHDPAQHHPQAV